LHSTAQKQCTDYDHKQIKPVVRKTTTPPPPAPPAQLKKGQIAAARRNSTVVPTIRRSDTELIGRPKREIHPPPPKDLPYADAPKKHRKSKRVKDGANSEQMKFCAKLLDGMFHKKQYGMAHPFYEPVGE
jgi:bromodomain-containing factor 1